MMCLLTVDVVGLLNATVGLCNATFRGLCNTRDRDVFNARTMRLLNGILRDRLCDGTRCDRDSLFNDTRGEGLVGANTCGSSNLREQFVGRRSLLHERGAAVLGVRRRSEGLRDQPKGC